MLQSNWPQNQFEILALLQGHTIYLVSPVKFQNDSIRTEGEVPFSLEFLQFLEF